MLYFHLHLNIACLCVGDVWKLLATNTSKDTLSNWTLSSALNYLSVKVFVAKEARPHIAHMQAHKVWMQAKSTVQCNLDYLDTFVQGAQIFRITEVLTIFSPFSITWYETALLLQQDLQKTSLFVISSIFRLANMPSAFIQQWPHPLNTHGHALYACAQVNLHGAR